MTSRLADRIATLDDETTAEVVRRLESGEPMRELGLPPVDLIAAIARVGLGPEGGEGLPLIRGESGHPRLAASITEASMLGLFPGSPRPARLSLVAGLLQVIDAWEASHTAAQEGDDLGDHVHAPYWHEIAHRREPDPANAHYWARRVGRHPILPTLAQLARPLLEAQADVDASPTARLLAGDAWSPSAFVDLCTQARPGTPTVPLARRLQRLEMLTLLEATAGVLLDRRVG